MGDSKVEEFDWVQIKKEIGSAEFQVETTLEKFKRKATENPFVPIGAFLTTAALTYGLYTLKTGQSRKSQLMMRARIIAQGFTVVALCGGIAAQAFKSQPTTIAENKGNESLGK